MRSRIFRLMKKRYLAFMIFVITAFSLAGEMYHLLILSNLKGMVVTLNYTGAEKGLNPDGSRFIMSEITNDNILNAAKKGLKIEKQSNNEIRQRLFITSKFSQNAMNAVIDDIESGMRGSFVPTTFHVYYTQKNKLGKNETYEFLDSLAKTYKAYFYENHAENNSVLRFSRDDESFSNYDYIEINDLLYEKAEQMLKLMKKHQEENRSFRSKDNVNYGTLCDELENFRDVELEKFKAYIVQNNITKNRLESANKLIFLIDKNTIDFNKKKNASDIAKTALAKYDPQIAAVAFVPSVDNTNSYYMSRTKTGIDDLAKNSYASGMEAVGISAQLDEYNNRFSKIQAASDTGEDMLAYTESYLSGILDELESVSKKIVKLDNEFLKYKTGSYLSYKVDSKPPVINLKIMIKFAVLGAALALAMIIYIEFFHSVLNEKTGRIYRIYKTLAANRKRRRSK